MLIEGQTLWLAQTNSWIVSAQGPGGECVIIDAPPDPSAILKRLETHGLKLVALLSTHGHIDHVGGVGMVVRAVEAEREDGSHIPVHIHDADRHMLLDPVGTSAQLGHLLERDGVDARPPERIEGLEDGQSVSGAGMTFTCIHTPGHTEGSVCFRLDVDGNQSALFSGDHLFKGSIGRTDLPGGDLTKLMNSMRDKILPLDDDVAVLPGHGPTTTIGRERRTNPYIQPLLKLQAEG